MHKTTLSSLCCLVLLCGFFNASHGRASPGASVNASYKPCQALVKFKDSRNVPAISHAKVQQLYAGIVLVELDEQKVSGKDEPDSATDALIADLNARPDVDYAHPNFRMRFSQSIPNDPLYPLQWNLAAINAPQAWNTTVGSSDVVIAILDSGCVMTH